MQKKITILPLLAVFLLSSQILVAQKVEDAVKYIYYQRYNSAKEILQKWVAGNATDINAQYWLGQAFLEEDNIPEARNVYQKALTATANAPLILVGIGHVEGAGSTAWRERYVELSVLAVLGGNSSRAIGLQRLEIDSERAVRRSARRREGERAAPQVDQPESLPSPFRHGNRPAGA